MAMKIILRNSVLGGYWPSKSSALFFLSLSVCVNGLEICLVLGLYNIGCFRFFCYCDVLWSLVLTSFFLLEHAKLYMKAADGGYVRAMYNISLCFSFGEGLTRNHQLARKWMKRAADRGHSKAQFEHGLALFSVSIYPCIVWCSFVIWMFARE